MGTCWVAIAFRSAWIADWLIVSLKTHTFGPNCALTASGQRLVASAGAGADAVAGDELLASAALTGTAASADAARAVAARTIGRANKRISAPHCAYWGKSQQECSGLGFLLALGARHLHFFHFLHFLHFCRASGGHTALSLRIPCLAGVSR